MKQSPCCPAAGAVPATPGDPSTKWEVYDRLISLIPEDLVVEDVLLGIQWTLVRSAGVGVAMTPPEGRCWIPGAGGFKGRKLKELAALIKSWNPFEAALGVAAVNSYVNAPSTIGREWTVRLESQAHQSVFETMKDELAGKKVAVVGHFPDLDDLARESRLSILERKPMESDFPDPACEYILEDQDFLFITGVSLINKTLPRLMTLGRRARMVLVGPSVPLAPFWFDQGIAALAGTIVIDGDRVWRHAAEGGDRSIFGQGACRVELSPADARCGARTPRSE